MEKLHDNEKTQRPGANQGQAMNAKKRYTISAGKLDQRCQALGQPHLEQPIQPRRALLRFSRHLAVQAAAQFLSPRVQLGMARPGKPPRCQELCVQLQHSERTCLASPSTCGNTSTSQNGLLGQKLYP